MSLGEVNEESAVVLCPIEGEVAINRLIEEMRVGECGRADPSLKDMSESRGQRCPTPLDGRGRTAVSPRCSEATPLVYIDRIVIQIYTTC